jgi:hypothetical protein
MFTPTTMDPDGDNFHDDGSSHLLNTDPPSGDCLSVDHFIPDPPSGDSLFHLTLALLQWTTVDNDNDDDDDDDPMLLLEPTADNDNNGTLQVERVPCCPPLLQLIVDKDYVLYG